MSKGTVMSFTFDERDADLKSYVFQAIGAASMAWTETPKGVFDDRFAGEIGEALLAKIKKLHPESYPVP